MTKRKVEDVDPELEPTDLDDTDDDIDGDEDEELEDEESEDDPDEVDDESELDELDEHDPDAGGQSGDLQGILGGPEAESESVRELLEEGNSFEAGIVSGIENAPDADAGPIRTREVPEDDVPDEYLEKDEPDTR